MAQFFDDGSLDVFNKTKEMDKRSNYEIGQIDEKVSDLKSIIKKLTNNELLKEEDVKLLESKGIKFNNKEENQKNNTIETIEKTGLEEER